MQPNGKDMLSKNFVSKYLTFKVKEVAASRIGTLHGLMKWLFRRSVRTFFTHNYLLNHMDKALWSKVLENMAAYEHIYVFIIMMQHLQANFQVVVTSLCSKLKAINIKNYDRENLSKTMTHIRSVVKCLCMLKLNDYNGVVRKKCKEWKRKQWNTNKEKIIRKKMQMHICPLVSPWTNKFYKIQLYRELTTYT